MNETIIRRATERDCRRCWTFTGIFTPIAEIMSAGEQSMSAWEIIQCRERSFAMRTKS